MEVKKSEPGSEIALAKPNLKITGSVETAANGGSPGGQRGGRIRFVEGGILVCNNLHVQHSLHDRFAICVRARTRSRFSLAEAAQMWET